jgi:hypothetical protein
MPSLKSSKQNGQIRPSLATTHPDLAKEWHPTLNEKLTPNDLTHGSNKKVWWLCSKGHEWEARLSQRVNKGSGCPECSRRAASLKKSLAVRNPELAEQWHPEKNGSLTPFDIVPGYQKKVWWICGNGHEWEDSPYNRRPSKGCPYCSNRRPTPENNLLAQFPKLAQEWHPAKNEQLTPEKVVSGSGKTVWWKCKNGHEWKARIVDRANGRRCAKCIGKEAHAGHNLAIKFPELAQEWNTERNGELTPFLVTPRSNKKVWWKCARGHEWESTISNRATGQNCPYCSPQTSHNEIRLFCELKALFDVVSWRKRISGFECDVFIPLYGIAVEYDGAHWHASKSEQDLAKNQSLQSMGVETIRVREHDLPRISPHDVIMSAGRAAELDIGTVKNVLAGMAQVRKLDEEHTKRIDRYTARSEFANSKEFRRILSYLPGPPTEKSLLAASPVLVKQWHQERNAPLSPEMFFPRSGRTVWWRCEKGHEWKASIINRSKGFGCPYCAGQRATPENNLAITFPDLATQWHARKNGIITPQLLTPKSNKIVWWICSRGHEWRASVHNRSSGTDCPYCAGQKVCEDNNLAAKYPDLINQWHPYKNGDLVPTMIMPGTRKKVWWQCAKGHEWQAVVSSRVTGVGCPLCAGKMATQEDNLKIMFPALMREWHPTKNAELDPSQIRPQSDRKAWWQCEKGHEWRAVVGSRTRGAGCPTCSGTRVTPYNNLAEQFPVIAKDWHPTRNGSLEPTDVRPGSDKKVWWMCENGHEWQRTVQIHVKSKRCPICKQRKMHETF